MRRMYLAFFFLIFLVMFSHEAAGQQSTDYTEGFANGRYWNKLIAADKLLTKGNEKDAPFTRGAYVAGLRDGIRTILSTLFSSSAEQKTEADLYRLIKPYEIPHGASIIDVVNVMDDFFKDSANINLPIYTSYIWAVLKINGASPEELDKNAAWFRSRFNNPDLTKNPPDSTVP